MQVHSSPYSLNQPLACSIELAPPTFFSKQMNITKESLHNLFVLWRTAIHSFLNESLTHHDALVGENACHLRAAALVDYFLNQEFKQVLLSISNKVHEIIERLRSIEITEKDSKGTIEEFLLKHYLLFQLPEKSVEQVKFIIDSYLLTLTKEKLHEAGLTLNERTSHEPIKSLGFVKNKAKNLISNAQKSLSSLSCAYVLDEAASLNDPALAHLLKLKFDAHQRSYLPQFIAGKVVLKRLLQKKRYLLLKIKRKLNFTSFDEIIICIKPNTLGTDFIIADKNVPADIPCIVASGSINYDSQPESKEEYFQRLMSHSFMDIFLATFASHPQYSGELKHLPPPFEETIEELNTLYQDLKNNNEALKSKEILSLVQQIKNEQEDYEQKKQYAVDKGCALENPSLLFFNHIYADMLDNYINNQMVDIELNELAAPFIFKADSLVGDIYRA